MRPARAGSIAMDRPRLRYLRSLDSGCMKRSRSARPARLCSTNHNHHVELLADHLTCKYKGRSNHCNDVGTVQSVEPVPTDVAVYYFEAEVLSAGERGQVTVGLANAQFPMSRQPGAEPDSFGFCGENGNKLGGDAHGEPYGPTFTTGDVVGCGLHFGRGEIFFTLNGRHLGCAFSEVDCRTDLYPTVGLHSAGELVRVNFGLPWQEAFRFDLDELLRVEREAQRDEVDALPCDSSRVAALVRQYLLVNGYANSFRALGEDGVGDGTAALTTLDRRKLVIDLVRRGSVLEAIQRVEELCPGMLARPQNRWVLFHLRCLHFFELVRMGHAPEAVAYAREAFSCFFGDPDISRDLRATMGLLAYRDPSRSPLGHLLSETRRSAVADSVNEAIIAELIGDESAEGTSRASMLELQLYRLVAARQEVRALAGGKGELFDLGGCLH